MWATKLHDDWSEDDWRNLEGRVADLKGAYKQLPLCPQHKAFSVLGRDFFLLFSNLITSILIARTLGPEIMGIWVILNTVPSYAEMLGRTKVDLAAVYFLGKGKYQIGDIASSLNLIAIVTSSLIIFPIMIFFDPISAALLTSEVDFYSTYLMLILLAIPLNLLYLNYMYLHICDKPYQ